MSERRTPAARAMERRLRIRWASSEVSRKFDSHFHKETNHFHIFLPKSQSILLDFSQENVQMISNKTTTRVTPSE